MSFPRTSTTVRKGRLALIGETTKGRPIHLKDVYLKKGRTVLGVGLPSGKSASKITARGETYLYGTGNRAIGLPGKVYSARARNVYANAVRMPTKSRQATRTRATRTRARSRTKSYSLAVPPAFNAWRAFVSAHAGQGYSRAELSRMYQAQKVGGRVKTTANRSRAGNRQPTDVQKSYRYFQGVNKGSGLTRAELSNMWADVQDKAGYGAPPTRPPQYYTKSQLEKMRAQSDWIKHQQAEQDAINEAAEELSRASANASPGSQHHSILADLF